MQKSNLLHFHFKVLLYTVIALTQHRAFTRQKNTLSVFEARFYSACSNPTNVVLVIVQYQAPFFIIIPKAITETTLVGLEHAL
jgi:hypothetical protein